MCLLSELLILFWLGVWQNVSMMGLSLGNSWIAPTANLITKTSSNENSIVLDCFCGSGTTLKSAQLNNRTWIGIDISEIAIKATLNKLSTIKQDIFVSKPDYEFIELNKQKMSL